MDGSRRCIGAVSTFLLLQQYDEGLLDEPAAQSGGVLASLDDVRVSLARLKADLISVVARRPSCLP